MNFSEYIAILSGDTSLLEKSRLEKKIAVLENLRTAHFRETNRAKYKLEDTYKEKEKTAEFLEKLKTDQAIYKQQLTNDKDGVKMNPCNLSEVQLQTQKLLGNN